MHELEKKALEDPFLADALEGYTYTSHPLQKNLSILQHQLEERIARQQENKNRFMVSWQRLSIAVAAAVIFVLAGVLFWMKMTLSTKPAAQDKWAETVLTPAKAIPDEPAPANGWSAYEKYLNENTRLPGKKRISGKVVVGFIINTDGSLSSIRIIKGLNPDYDTEAIRLVREGPKWNPVEKPEAASLTLDFSD